MEILIFWLLHVDLFLFPIRVRRLHYLHGPTSLHRHMYLSIGPPNSHEQRESQKGGWSPSETCQHLQGLGRANRPTT